jgi:hypothetical protein
LLDRTTIPALRKLSLDKCQGAPISTPSENPAFKNIELTEESAFEVWGVIAKSIRML